MSDQENINHVQTFASELDQGNIASVKEYIADEFFAHVPVDDEPMSIPMLKSIIKQRVIQSSALFI